MLRVDPALVGQRNAPWENIVPTVITQDGTLTGDRELGAPTMAVPSPDDPVAAAAAAVVEAQLASGLRSHGGPGNNQS